MFRRFAHHDEQAITALRDYWDGVEQGALFPAAPRLDPRLAATVDRLHTDDDAPVATPAFAAQLLDRLLRETAATQPEVASAPQLPDWDPPLPPRPAPAPVIHRWRLSRPWAASAGSLVLVILIIAAGFSIWRASPDPAPTLAPLRSEVTLDGVVIQTLLEAPVPAGELPESPSKWIANFKFSLEPDEHWRDRPSPCQLSRQKVVGLVESGTLAMINAGPFVVTRSDGTTESIQAGERADVHAGDSWVYFSDRTETNVQKWNPGSDPMVAYQTDWALDDSCESTPPNPEWIWADSIYGVEFDSSRPMVVTIERAFIEPGAPISWEDAHRLGLVESEADVFRVIGVESGTLEEALVQEALTQSLPGQRDPLSRRTLEPGAAWSVQSAPRLREGTELQFEAGPEEPLVLTSIAWSYADPSAGEATPTARAVSADEPNGTMRFRLSTDRGRSQTRRPGRRRPGTCCRDHRCCRRSPGTLLTGAGCAPSWAGTPPP
jgi:hypothetical protein